MVSLQCSPDRLVLKGLSINGTSTGHVILERAIKHSSPMLLILQQVTPLKNPQGTVETGMFPVLLLARMPSPKAKRFDEEPSKKQFIVCGDDEQLRTAKEKFAALETTVGVLKQGLKLTYAELVILDKALNDEIMSTEPFSDPGAMRKLDLDPILRPVLYIDGVVFRGEQGFNGLLQDFDEEMVPVQHVGLLGKGAMKALLGKNHICPPKLYQDLLNSPDAATRKPMTLAEYLTSPGMHWGALDGADTYVEVGVLYCGLLRALEESGDVMSPIGAGAAVIEKVQGAELHITTREDFEILLQDTSAVMGQATVDAICLKFKLGLVDVLLVKLPPRVPQDGHKDALTFANSKLRLRSSFQEPPLLLLPEKEAVGEPVSRNLFSAAYASKVSESLLEPTVLLYDGEDGFCLPVCRVVLVFSYHQLKIKKRFSGDIETQLKLVEEHHLKRLDRMEARKNHTSQKIFKALAIDTDTTSMPGETANKRRVVQESPKIRLARFRTAMLSAKFADALPHLAGGHLQGEWNIGQMRIQNPASEAPIEDAKITTGMNKSKSLLSKKTWFGV